MGCCRVPRIVKKAKDLKNDIEGNGVDLNLGAFKLKFRDYLRGLFLKKRIPAKYLLVFMIADELQRKKTVFRSSSVRAV